MNLDALMTEATALADELRQRYPHMTWEVDRDAGVLGGVDGHPVITFSDEDTCYTDPFAGGDIRFPVDPVEEHQFTRADAERLARFNLRAGMVANWVDPEKT